MTNSTPDKDRNQQLTWRRLVTLLPIVAAVALVAQPAAAQSVLDEVIVTAQKREESIQKVGIAITAFSAEQMEALGLTNNTEVASFTPGVHISGNNAGHTQQFTIRGATQNDFADIAEAPNAVYVDEAYQATGQSQLFANFDMERVEVLKGPQGTLFGRNATGGLVHFITKAPTQETEAYIDAQYGSYDTVRVEGAISGALGSTLSGRIAGFHTSHDDVMQNEFTDADLPATPGFLAAQGRGPLTSNPDNHDDLWTDEQNAFRGQLLWEPNDDVTFLVKGQWAKSQPASGPYQHVATMAYVDDTDGDGAVDDLVETDFMEDVDPALRICEQIDINTNTCANNALDLDFDGVRPNNQGDFFGFFEPDGTDDVDVRTDHTLSGNDRVEIWGVTGKLNWDLGWADLISVTNYSDQAKRQSLDVDSGPAPQFIVMNQSEFDWFSEEVRLEGEAERFRWIAGFYYLNIDGKYSQGLADTIGGINVYGGLFFNGFISTANDFLEGTLASTLETNSYSIFGQVDYDVTDELTFILGWRGIIEDKDYDYNMRMYINTRDDRVDGEMFAGGTPLVNPFTGDPDVFLPPFSDKTSDFLWSGKVQLNYDMTEDVLLYASANRGVKAGSFNAPLLTFLTQDQYGYKEEILYAYEIGFKSTFMDGRARLNGSAYYYDYKDYQAFQFIGTSGAVFNADATYYGGELELIMNPVDNLDLIVGLGLIDPEVKNLAVAVGLERDVEPTFTPKVQWSGIGRYSWPDVIAGGTVAAQMDGIYRSRAFHNINNFGSHRMDSYWIGNAHIDWTSADDRWTIGAFVNNFTDTRNQMIGFELSTLCGCDEQSFGQPRWWGVRAKFSYF
jgi:iron complex outermembrane receptor protein